MNPLEKYRIENNVSWQRLAERCDVHVSRVAALAKMTPERAGGVTLRIAAQVKHGTGVNLMKYFEDGLKSSAHSAPSGEAMAKEDAVG